jgi:hypothetical protein
MVGTLGPPSNAADVPNRRGSVRDQRQSERSTPDGQRQIVPADPAQVAPVGAERAERVNARADTDRSGRQEAHEPLTLRQSRYACPECNPMAAPLPALGPPRIEKQRLDSVPRYRV